MDSNESPNMNTSSGEKHSLDTQNASRVPAPQEQTDSTLDEQVATMTDQILVAGQARPLSPLAETDDELRALEGVISGLAGMLTQPPPAALAERLNARLDEEWARQFGGKMATAPVEQTATPADSPMLPREKPLKPAMPAMQVMPAASSTQTRPAANMVERTQTQSASRINSRTNSPRSARLRQNWTALALAAAVLALVVASVLIVPREESVTGTLSGTALGDIPAEAVIALGAMVAVGIVILAVRRRK